MNDVANWASSQPIWLQVAIGLFVFIVLFPLALYAASHAVGEVLEWLFEIGPSFASALRLTVVVLAVVFAPFALWGLASELAWGISFPLARELKLPAQQYDTLAFFLSVAICVLVVCFYAVVVYQWREQLRAKLRAWGFMLGNQ